MVIVDERLYTKKELADLFNQVMKLKYSYEKNNCLLQFVDRKQKELFEEVDELLKKMDEAKLTHETFLEVAELRQRTHQKIEKLYKKIDDWGNSIRRNDLEGEGKNGEN